MIKRAFIASTAAMALLATAPASAQRVQPDEEETVDFSEDGEDPSDELAELDAFGEIFGALFGEAEPLTEEQEARLPAATSVVEKIFPDGTYAKMMEETMGGMMEGFFGELLSQPNAEVSRLTGVLAEDLIDVDAEAMSEALALLDPQNEARNKVIGQMSIDLMSKTMTSIEPAYREGLARAYAVRFTEAELTELDAYFQTPVGAKYAAESLLIFSDPQVMAAMNEMAPAMIGAMPEVMAGTIEAAEEFPEPRSFSDLSPAEQARLADLLGVTEAELRASEPQEEPAITTESIEA